MSTQGYVVAALWVPDPGAVQLCASQRRPRSGTCLENSKVELMTSKIRLWKWMPFDSCGDDGSYTCTWLLRPSVLTCIYSGWPLINTKPCKTSRRKDNNVDITFHRGAPNHHFCRSHPPKCLVATLTRTSSSLVCRWYASVAFPSSLKSHFSHSQWPGASGTSDIYSLYLEFMLTNLVLRLLPNHRTRSRAYLEGSS